MSDNDKKTILLVDDSPDTIELLKRNLAHNYRLFDAGEVPKAIEVLNSEKIDLVITDFKMPNVSGLDLIRHVRENCPDTEIIMITGYATIEGAVKAVKTGAEEYLSKPFTQDELKRAIKKAFDKLDIRRKAKTSNSSTIPAMSGLIGESQSMLKVFRTIKKASQANATVLISGESGTGKELVARAIHYSSNRSSAPFIPVNCGAIPENLLESELFGHVKGAFTGANETRAGFFQTADGGSIFLDEIGEMSLHMQVKLLRVLQEKEIMMVGSRRPAKVNIRIIAATNKDLLDMVRKGSFREDLYYRLNVITLDLPSLKERENDVILLVKHFTKKYGSETGRENIHFTDEALQVFLHYNYPGNVRELENIIQRLLVMADSDTIDVTDLPQMMRFSVTYNTGFNRSLAEVEAEYIKNVLDSVNGNKSKAARILNIDRKTLRSKIESLE